jgi:hypothetical protein
MLLNLTNYFITTAVDVQNLKLYKAMETIAFSEKHLFAYTENPASPIYCFPLTRNVLLT